MTVEEEAAELLRVVGHSGQGITCHCAKCDAIPAVAERLRERDEKIREMFGDNMALHECIAALEAENERLRAQLESLLDDPTVTHSAIARSIRAALARRNP